MLDAMPPSYRTIGIGLASIAIVLIGLGFSGVFSSPSTLLVDVTPAGCDALTYSVTLKDANGIGIGDSFVQTSINGALQEKLKTDQNGRFSSTLKVSAWCNQEITFKTEYTSSLLHKGASFEKTITVQKNSCEDGTSLGVCSTTKPSWLCASNATLLFDCTTCGCSQGKACDNNECVAGEIKTSRLIADLQKSLVKLNNSYASGSGIIFGYYEDGLHYNHTLILTNHHVLETAVSISDVNVVTSDGITHKANKIYYAPKGIDLAMLDANDHFGTQAFIDYAVMGVQGQNVVALGSPLGIQGSVSKGIISNFVPDEENKNYSFNAIQTDAAINPGNSGGGLFLESSGQLLGLNTYKYVDTEGLGFAIDIRELNALPNYANWLPWTAPATCWDGTPEGACSHDNIPGICYDGDLYAACGTCGCPENQYCITSGEQEGFCSSY